MFCSASDTIASDHPELVDEICSIDRYLHEVGEHPFRLERAADLLEIEPRVLERLLRCYEQHGVVERVEIAICPEDGEVLEVNDKGDLWCDVCEGEYRSDEYETETAYRARTRSIAATPSHVPPFTRGYGLLVGVGDYRHLRRLAKTAADAKDLHDLLTDPAYGGYPLNNVRLLLDNDGCKSEINDALDWLARSAGPEDTAVIFFSGHGAQRVGGFEPGEYLCPVEADWSSLRSTAISTDELTVALRAIRAGRMAVFLDACHSGGVGEPKNAALQVRPGLSASAYNRLYDRLAEGGGRVIIASCGPEEVSWELPGMPNGLFTYYLLDGLRGAATDADGAVRILELFKYVSERVASHKNDQHPFLKAELDNDFPIALAPSRRQGLAP